MAAAQQGVELVTYLKDSASSSELKGYLDKGVVAWKEQADLLSGLLRSAGGEPNGMSNQIVEGMSSAGREIVGSASDPDVRDAAIIATAQIVLHYAIAGYGTLASTAKYLELEDHAKTFSQLVDEVKKSDEVYTRMAEDAVNNRAKS